MPGWPRGSNLGSARSASGRNLKCTRDPKGASNFLLNSPVLCLLVHAVSPEATRTWLSMKHQNRTAKGQKQEGRPARSRIVRAPSTTLRTVRSQYALLWCRCGVVVSCGYLRSLHARISSGALSVYIRVGLTLPINSSIAPWASAALLECNGKQSL